MKDFKSLQLNLLSGIILFLSFLPYSVQSQVFYPSINNKAQKVNIDTLNKLLVEFESLGRKEIGDTGLKKTAQWIINKYKGYGYDNIHLDSFKIANKYVMNIIVTKKGSVLPDEYLILDGHYDTEGGPGVNDNGSGTTAILETARLLADTKTGCSIKFIHFTAEEAGLLGSRHYVQNTAVKNNLKIRLVLNIDQVGGTAGMNNSSIACERDIDAPYNNNSKSYAYTDTLVDIVQTYSMLNTTIAGAYGSDYIPFQEQGYVITGLFETNETPFNHTVKDSLVKMDLDYFHEVVKSTTAATLFFSRDYSQYESGFAEISDDIPQVFFNNREIYVRNVSTSFTLKLFSLRGRLLEQHRLKSAGDIFIDHYSSGMYLYQLITNDKKIYSGKLIRR